MNDTCWDPGTYRLNISLASCFGDKFACGDGACQPLDNRCNQRKDCLDGSDELDCNILEMDTLTYVKDYIPPSLKQGQKLNIIMRIEIFRFLKLSETDSISSIQFKMQIMWKDARLNFNHLRDDLDRNILTEEEKSSIWTPVIIFHNTKDKFMSSVDVKTTILVDKKGSYTTSPVSHPWKDLEYSHTYSADFQCEFNLQYYPFDTQECYMIFSLPTRVENLLKLDLVQVDYQGEKMLSQYTVDEYIIVDRNTTKEILKDTTKSSQVIKFVLKRRFIYQVVTVYVPTFCLMLIMHTTHYYPRKDFEASVMVGLTGMLVMTTLLLSVSNNLPPTNYIKLIDVWMLFGMISPFFDIIVHTVAGYYYESIQDVSTKVLYYLAPTCFVRRHCFFLLMQHISFYMYSRS